VRLEALSLYALEREHFLATESRLAIMLTNRPVTPPSFEMILRMVFILKCGCDWKING
jgi:hypothetical protein